jgi:hypothetical protein
MRIGIDNGISGGLVAISDHDGSYIDGITMPILKWKKRNEIDVSAVRAWIKNVTGEPYKLASITIEEPGGSKSAKAACSMAGSFHSLRALLEIEWPKIWHRITPQSWQKAMLPNCKAGDTKPRALALAKELWPDETFLASPRCKVPHDGLIDAALIAEFSRRKKL